MCDNCCCREGASTECCCWPSRFLGSPFTAPVNLGLQPSLGTMPSQCDVFALPWAQVQIFKCPSIAPPTEGANKKYWCWPNYSLGSPCTGNGVLLPLLTFTMGPVCWICSCQSPAPAFKMASSCFTRGGRKECCWPSPSLGRDFTNTLLLVLKLCFYYGTFSVCL